jgi:diguanylate cyclase (GGDEF)-like protein
MRRSPTATALNSQAFISELRSYAMHDLDALHTLVINSLEEQIAVIDQSGTIIDVNHAWNQFGIENGIPSEYSWAGKNYLEILSAAAAAAGGDNLAGEAGQGIMDIVNGKSTSFYHEYPCHSPDQQRWFMMRVTCLKDDSRNLFVISHYNITLRKLAEERAEQLAMHDPLTGLANRRYFNLFLDRETRRSIRNRSVISLIEIDIDYFKEYNDELGHLAGDQCLVDIGQILKSFSRRPGDLAVRFGGDEFILILGDTGFTEAKKISEAILKAIHDLGIVFGDARQITVSLGMVSVTCDKQLNEDFLLRETDKALYRAKSTGRNRIEHVQIVASEVGAG